ncbi:hypothetical protein NCU16357 [Neurospora crassa OR74A]|uniref:Uncharacterized protein n=1 Tax=Neurospora crassa (strain ATCC 24698 / 74-OR23-1A / CBS 708.71 / DSM 1257 / FGSC 987) TaxID=367110 RepID=V5IRF6_NEUCR|nr:hypothetical protein NCU16357 [Neurospora crassa OR74A]ESA43891.1 hypothetical protein NCU16357 [Neurospora crassa OR74A]|eukprot:XP_011393356.1 hypothetical protein NCU16357 [Neurospora crassa OR74A]
MFAIADSLGGGEPHSRHGRRNSQVLILFSVKRPSTARLAVQYSLTGPAYQHLSDALIWNCSKAIHFENGIHPPCKSFVRVITETFELQAGYSQTAANSKTCAMVPVRSLPGFVTSFPVIITFLSSRNRKADYTNALQED